MYLIQLYLFRFDVFFWNVLKNALISRDFKIS